jgi:hypothetical protein
VVIMECVLTYMQDLVWFEAPAGAKENMPKLSFQPAQRRGR